MFNSLHNSIINWDEKLVLWSVSISFGIPTRANIFRSSIAMAGVVVECSETALGYQVA